MNPRPISSVSEGSTARAPARGSHGPHVPCHRTGTGEQFPSGNGELAGPRPLGAARHLYNPRRPRNGGRTATPPRTSLRPARALGTEGAWPRLRARHRASPPLPGQRGPRAYPSCPTCGLQGPLPPGPGSLEDDWLLGELLKGRRVISGVLSACGAQRPDPARCVSRTNSLLQQLRGGGNAHCSVDQHGLWTRER